MENLTVAPSIQANTISFNIERNSTPILELRANGDILVKGKLVENDKEVVNALREMLSK